MEKKSIHFFFKIDLGLIVLSHEKDEQIPKVGTWQKKFSKNKKLKKVGRISVGKKKKEIMKKRKKKVKL